MSSELYIGIDFGTSYSYVSIFENGKVTIIPNSKGFQIPSMIAYKTNEKYFIGEDTIELFKLKSVGWVFDIKRFIGKNRNDRYISDIIDKKNYPFEFEQDKKGKLQIKLSVIEENKNKNQKEDINPQNLDNLTTPAKKKEIIYYPEEFVTLIFKHIKKIAENYLKMKKKSEINIENAVITVPADFETIQKDLIKKSAENSGFKNIRLLNEPTAAAFAYGIIQNENERKKILVIDIGGGTYDITLLKMNGNNFSETETNGDQFFGGEDFDFKLREYFIEKNKLHEKNFRLKKKLKKYCEEIKIKLSKEEQIEKEIKLLNDSIFLKITRKEFENICSDLFEKILKPINEIFQKTKIKKDEINDVILVGGTTKIPKIKEIIKSYFPNSKINDEFDPETIVVKGAAIYAAKIAKIKDTNIQRITMNKILPHSISTNKIVNENGRDVEICDIVIKKGTNLPASSEFEYEDDIIYSTAEDNQTVIDNYIYEGEGKYPNENKLIGIFSQKNIPPKKKGEMKYKYVFKVDENGIVSVEVSDLNNTNKEKFTIQNEKSFNQINPNLDLKYSNEKNYETLIKFNEKFENLKEKINNEKNPEINIINYNDICNLINDLINNKLKLTKNIEKNNENLENLIYYVKILFKFYNKMLNELKDYINENNIVKNIEYYLDIFSNFNFDMFEIIDIFTIEKYKNFCLKFYIKFLFNKGKNKYHKSIEDEKNMNIEDNIFKIKKKDIENLINNLINKFNKSKNYFSSVLIEIKNLNKIFVTDIEKKIEEESKKHLKILDSIITYYEGIILEKDGRDEKDNLIDINNILDALNKYLKCISDLNDKGSYLDNDLYMKFNNRYLFLSKFLEKKMKENFDEKNQQIRQKFFKVKKDFDNQIILFANFLIINYPTDDEEKKEKLFTDIGKKNNESILEDLTEIYNVDNYFYNRENDQNLRELIGKIYDSISRLKNNL